MALKHSGPPSGDGKTSSKQAVDAVVAAARRANQERMQGYREQSLRIHPWVCARCGRHFTHKNLNLLTVHHKDHNHDNNPPDGSNWENLCVYCHDHEHGRYGEDMTSDAIAHEESGTMSHNPFASLADMLKTKRK